MKKKRNSRHSPQAVLERGKQMRMIESILRQEPVIRIHDRRPRYFERKQAAHAAFRAERKLYAQSPRRKARVQTNLFLKAVLPKEVYKKVHDCKREWSKLKSWRASQGSGSRKRTKTELANNKRSFHSKDC